LILGHHSHINQSMERDVNQIEVQKPTKPITTLTLATSYNIIDPNEVVMKELKDLPRPKPASDPKSNPTKAKGLKRNITKLNKFLVTMMMKINHLSLLKDVDHGHQ